MRVGIPVQIIVDEDAAILQVLPFRKHIGRDKDIDFSVAYRLSPVCYWHEEQTVRPTWRYVLCVSTPLSMRRMCWLTERLSRSIGQQLGSSLQSCLIEITGGIFVIGEEQHFLPLEFACQELLETCKLGVIGQE